MTLAGGYADAAPPAKQIVVIRAKKTARAKVTLVPGDRVAVLSVTRPPSHLVESLSRQTGAAMTKVERIEQIGPTLRVALYLSSEAYKIRLRRLSKRRAGSFSVIFYPKAHLPALKPYTLIGKVPDTPPRQPWPSALPPAPKRHPCTRRVKARRLVSMLNDSTPPSGPALAEYAASIRNLECRDFFLSRVAASYLARGRSLGALKTWAFQFSNQDRWLAYRYAYSYTALVAATVLLRSGLFPEAEVLLATDRMQATPRLAPYRALLMGDLLLRKKDRKQAIPLLRALLRDDLPAGPRDAAALRLIDLALAEGEQMARWALDSVASSVSDASPVRDRIAIRAGELALAMGERKRAKKFFTRAIRSKDRRARSHAVLRLADLTVERGTRRAKKRALKMYERVDRRLTCIDAMTRLRKNLLDNRDRELLEQNVMDAVTQPACDGHAIEARYAMSKLSVVRDQFDYAISLLDEATSLHAEGSSSRQTFDRLTTEIAALSVARLNRNRAWSDLAKLYRERLKSRQQELSIETRLDISRALNRVGLHRQAAELVRTTLKQVGNSKRFEDLTLELAHSYLENNELYLAEIVLDYFRRARSRSEKIWQVYLTQAELLVRQGNGAAALGILKNAEKSTPDGDPRARFLVLTAEAEYQLGQAERAAASLIAATKLDWHPSLDVRGRGVNVLSACVRKCKRKTLVRLLKALEGRGQDALLSERIRYLSTKRGIGPKPKLDEASVWKRLEAVAPKLKVRQRGPTKGANR